MNRLTLALALLPLAAAGPLAAAERAATPTHQVRLNGHTFTLPVGFEIELVAGPPLVDRPISADFDEQGRLYVSDSSGSNENVKEQLKKKPHRVLRLESSKGDGHFDRRTVFADHLMFPEGTLWHNGSLYVSAVPVIWQLTDTHGTGVADRRSVWFDGKTLTGCANDLHGPYPGPDGWIYWCKGAFARQTYERPGQKPFETRAAHIFRARPDGTGVEPVMTGGMDNPVDVVFTPGGERVFTCTFLQFPGGGRRDGLIHAVYGAIYGKDWDVIHEPQHKWTGPAVMPVLSHLGPAAPCGLTRYESRVFGPEYQDNLFACLFNMQKVTRHVLTPHGATFTARDEDFLVSDSKDFHPTDVQEDADGSLLVIDTGGWYKLCCPTSQLYKPDVLGAIYRVRRTGAPRPDDPRGLKLAWDKMSPAELANLLGDARPAVRRRVIQTLGARGPAAVPALVEVLRTAPSVEARQSAVWAATRIDHADARAAVRRALDDGDETVRQVAGHSVSLWRDRDAVPFLLQLLRLHSAQNRRVAAEALGRIGDPATVPALLQAAGRPADRALEHSLTYALIQIGDAKGTAAGLTAADLTRRTALVALDQMGALDVKAVTQALGAGEPRLKETAWWIAGRHPEWGGALAGFLRERLAARGQTPAQREELATQLARLARSMPIRNLLAERLRDPDVSREERLTVLRAMARSGLKVAPDSWAAELFYVLQSKDAEVLKEAVAAARAVPPPKQRAQALGQVLRHVAANTAVPAGVRLGALAAVPGGLPEVPDPLFAFLRSRLDREQPVADRGLAADVLARAKLTSTQLIGLTGALKDAGPLEVDRLLEAFARSGDEKVGHQLVAALQDPTVRAGLRVDTLKPRLAKFGGEVAREAEKLYAALDTDTAKQRARLDELLAGLKGGDVRRGQAVFNSAKAACSACHAIGYIGGHVGPDLTSIGRIRTERDLLESIVFPSASFVRGFEPVVVITHDGKAYNGVVRKDAADEIVLATGPNQEVRIARDDIEDLQPSRVSVMPAGLDQQLAPRELADLVTFLKACR
jgi:putative membrane-bound dehydrogenase-like protein